MSVAELPVVCVTTNGAVANGKTAVLLKNDGVCINERLPKELLIRILSYLDITTLCKCSRVCKFWYECAFDGSIWKSVNLFDFQCDVQPKVIEMIAERSRGFLRDLRLKGCRYVTDDAIEHFTQQCRLIRSLDFSGCQCLTNRTCDHLGQNCSSLMQLYFESCQAINDVGMKLLKRCVHLTCLDVSWCTVGDDGVKAIASSCFNLQRLWVVGCRGVTSAGVEVLARNCNRLLLVKLNYCGQGITDDALVHLALGCPDLRVLAVSHCLVSDRGLRALAGNVPGATSASNGYNLNHRLSARDTENGHGRFLPVDPRLASSTAINRQAGNGVERRRTVSASTALLSSNGRLAYGQQPLAGCLDLRTLEVAHCVSVTDSGLAALTRSCTKLEKLDLEDCGMITDSTLLNLATNCPDINTLVLSHCDLVTDTGIARLCHPTGPCRLQTLAMDNCPLLTDASLDHLSSNCRSLKKLDLYDCQQITRQAIFNLELQQPQLSVHAYFAPGTPPALALERRRRICRCCTVL